MASEASSWIGARGEKWRAQLTGMEAMLAVVDEPLIAALALDGPLRIVDVGCGGGGTTLRILREAPLGSTVLGVDISPTLIDVAQGRVAERGALRFQLGDMAHAPPPEALYDRLVSRFGVMFFEEPATAFANLAGWLAPGGRFAFAVWGPLADNAWLNVVRDVMAEVTALPATEPDTPGPFRYAESDELLALLTRAGFAGLEVRELRVRFALGGGLPAAQAADFALAGFATFAELLEQAGPTAFERARSLLTERLLFHELDGQVRLNARVHIVSGFRQKSSHDL